MKRRCSRFLAGLLAAVMVVSSGGLEVAARRSVGQWAEVDAEDGKNLDTNSKAEEDSDSNEDAKDSTTSEEEQKDDSSTSDEENKESNESSNDDETDNMPKETPQKEDPAKEEDKKEDSDKTDTSDQDLEDKDVLDKNSDEKNTSDKDAEQNPADTDKPSEEKKDTEALPTEEEPEVEKPEERATSVSANSLRVLEGSIEVRVISGVPVNSDQTFEVKLQGPEDFTETLVLPRRAKGESDMAAPSESVRFPRLTDGTYRLSVHGDGYLTYTQNIEVDGMGYRVQLYTGNAVVGTPEARPGLLFRGDVNGDGKLDDADATAIVDAIESGTYEAIYDLDKNGAVDLIDLNYLTDVLEHQAVQQAIPEKVIPPEEVKVSASKGTLVEGSLESMLEGKGVVLRSDASGEISADNPIELSFDFEKDHDSVAMEGMVVASPKGSENGIAEGHVLVVYEEDGQEFTGIAEFSAPKGLRAVSARGYKKNFPVKLENGSMVIDFSGLIAVKKVTLFVTKTSNTSNLAEISRVEFLNDMESRIPEPEMNIPKNITVTPANKMFTLQWDKEANVTSYEISITVGEDIEYRRTTATTLTIQQFKNDKLENGTEYIVRVQSVNGEWKSGFSDAIKAVPKVDKVPPAPDHVKITSGVRSLEISWGETEDADTYTVYYKEASASSYEKVSGITGLYYLLEGLKDDTTYQVYVTASNDLGEGKPSLTASEKTLSGLVAAKLPTYKLINTDNGAGALSNHIKSASITGSAVMVDSNLDIEAGSALGLFDNNYNSYMEVKDWDYAGAYPAGPGGKKGIIVELDDFYSVGMISLAEPIDRGSYTYASVYYWDKDGKQQAASNISIVRRSAGNNRWYYLIKFKEAVETNKLMFGIGRYGSSPRLVTVSEVRIHEYDSLEQDILNLYTDNLYLTLREDVTEATLDELQERLDTQNQGDYHPEKEMLQKELDAARKLLNTEGLGNVLKVNPRITSHNDVAVGGRNGWQPLGVAAAPGDDLVVYVGRSGMKEGANTSIQLVYTQYHAEAGGFFKTINLKIGRNEISLNKLSSTEAEKGGALYIQYNGKNPTDKNGNPLDDYAVRVSGGGCFPILNLYGVTDEAERNSRIHTYVEELNAYIGTLKAEHESTHMGGNNEHLKFAYGNGENCILNSTDIVTDQMMLSVPATQVASGLGADKEVNLKNTLQAMEDMLVLFYQHKGLTNSFAEGTDAAIINKNHLPYRYLNIRYMRMFAGAFMYASGNHIGIEWGSVPGVVSGVPIKADANGKYESGVYFGWGIAHEIGHDINEGAYAYAEVTNNYFSVLAQAKDTNDSVRFKYSNVYDKVTSGTTGYASNVFTQLGMYWQLHLAYDKDYNYKTYGNYQEIMDNLFFARVDSYARNPAAAPGSIALTLSGDRDQKLMRLASAAAQKDLSEFFTRWGMVPDADTQKYVSQFPKETRAIYYVDDESRVFTMGKSEGSAIKGKSIVTATASIEDSTVTLNLGVSAGSNELHGYEISRVFIENGKAREEIAGFTTDATFTDQVAFAANHVVSYKVTAIDKWMNRSLATTTEAVKIGGDGKIDKSFWTMATNMTSKQQVQPPKDDEENWLSCEAETLAPISLAADDDATTTYTGSIENAAPYVLIQLNQSTKVTALRYQLQGSGTPIGKYLIEVSMNGENYTKVKEGTFDLNNGSQTVYFENGKDPWVCTYDAVYIKLTAVGQSGKELSITELDLYGPSGDNVELLETKDGEYGIGKLSADFVYDADAGEKIPAGSIIFTGEYKGNPAYNVFVLYDEDGKIVGSTNADGTLESTQIILAPELTDEKAMLGETSEGRWVYWLPSGTSLPSKIRVEMYRVDNALTNEGQRMVSDTELVTIPTTLPSITLKGSTQ